MYVNICRNLRIKGNPTKWLKMTNEETVRNEDVIKNLRSFIHDGALMHFAAIKQHSQKAAVAVYT